MGVREPRGVGVSVDVDLCVDCVAVDANGTDDLGDDSTWPGFLEEWDGWLFGGVRCGGEEEDDLWCDGHWAPPGRACDGCGSGLGGTRFCYIAFPRPGGGPSTQETNLVAGVDIRQESE